MPNHCQNHLVLSHADPEQIRRAVRAINDGTFFQEFYPCPAELFQEGLFEYGGKKGIDNENARSKVYEQFGFTDANGWRSANWGTKWDAYDCDIVEESYEDEFNSLTVDFDTAWAPPTEFYNELVEQGFGVDAMYHEFGMAFCGQYLDGTDMYVEYNDALDNIPDEIDEQFGVRQSIAAWNEDDARYEADAEAELDQIEMLVAEGLGQVYEQLKAYSDRSDFADLVATAARNYILIAKSEAA